MATKRKSGDFSNRNDHRNYKKPRQARQQEEAKLLFSPRPDWHAAELPALKGQNVTSAPSQRLLEDLFAHATNLLQTENATYDASQKNSSSQHKFFSTIMASGTLEDKVSALTLLVQESPLHATKAFESLVGLSRKKSREQALMAVAALKDLLGQGGVLPGDRKLRAFAKQPGLISALQGKVARWSEGEPLPGGLQEIHLLVWAFEDWLKKAYFELLQVLETWCNDEVSYARTRAITYVWELLKDKPEQEENLLRLLVNKLGDPDRKIASRASHLLLQLETEHPAMKLVVTNSVEADCLFRPGQSLHAKYYAIITLNQTVLGKKEEELANRLLDIYFSLFIQLLKPIASDEDEAIVAKRKVAEREQGGGGKAGKMAAKKRKAEERTEESVGQLRDKMTAQVLAGVNRAFPYADVNDPNFEQQLNTIFRVTHSENFNTCVQALILLQQISSRKHFGAERYYRTLYESLLDPRLITSSKQIMYLNLLYKSLKSDLNAKRVQAFVKRLSQTINLHEPPFACGIIYLISELEGTFPSIRNMLTEPEIADEDEEEHFYDVPETADGAVDGADASPAVKKFSTSYDAKKRDPEHAHADRSCLWDILPFLQHFHPSVALFAENLYLRKKMPPKPDPAQHSLMHFLDRFVYRNPRTKQGVTHGSSIMQPMGGSSAADLLFKAGNEISGAKAQAPVNAEAFWTKKVEDVPVDEVFFHSYFNAAGNSKKRAATTAKDAKKRRSGDDEDSEDEGEEEIWQAIANSKPEVDGDDEDDDLSMGDLESAFSDSDLGSEGGINLGGGDDGDEDAEAALNGKDEMDGDFPEFESDDEAMFDDDDDVPEGLDDESEEEGGKELSHSQKKRKERKKLKSLPTFASAEDYAKLLDADDDDNFKV
ncbi:CBF-domain-containing protein [Dissoconium aciculare CBS 342.82]|uniref:CBF-domain-containing protein n=1 Tax=Dissoconium aciculare CBS 342.82 TaxID=1314786 RepID=A0A6J3MD81_9PEZI|nr:CBF-domain-containing protein [Dissoconium aciculare CBS 342.82]KAF1825843.1 CBF-domain-containing protein [Dissoconium aciculare CBS 342.82]